MREEEGCEVRDAALCGLGATSSTSSEDSGSSFMQRWKEELEQAQVQVRHGRDSTKRTRISGQWHAD
jgi:hypothetical protein